MPDTHEYLVNTKFPEFSLYDDEEKLVSRADIEGKWTVIFFYPKDDSPGCTLQSCSFSQIKRSSDLYLSWEPEVEWP